MCWSSTKQISLSSHLKGTCSSNNDLPWGNFLLFPEIIFPPQNPPPAKIFFLQEIYIVISIFIKSKAAMFFIMINFKRLFFSGLVFIVLQTQQSIKHSLMFTFQFSYFTIYIFVYFSSTVCPRRASQWNIRGETHCISTGSKCQNETYEIKQWKWRRCIYNTSRQWQKWYDYNLIYFNDVIIYRISQFWY